MLGNNHPFSYGEAVVIGFLRLVGLINAAVWVGSAVFFVIAAGTAPGSESMRSLIGPRNFPYFSPAIYHLIAGRYYELHIVCSFIALMHMGVEWVYLGKNPRRFWFILLLGLSLLGGVEKLALQPHLAQTHRAAFASRALPGQREDARRSYIIWNTVSRSFQFLMAGCLGLYLWRTANPPDPARFVPAAKFRS